MIRVIEEKEVPRAQVECGNCGSLLEYGNADLLIDYEVERENPVTTYLASTSFRPRCITCPVCGCKVSASWIIKNEK